MSIAYGVSHCAEGSARVRIGETEVIAGVKLSLEKPYPDTPAQGNLMIELDGQPALERAEQVLQELPDAERDRLQHGLYIGRPVKPGAVDGGWIAVEGALEPGERSCSSSSQLKNPSAAAETSASGDDAPLRKLYALRACNSTKVISRLISSPIQNAWKQCSRTCTF